MSIKLKPIDFPEIQLACLCPPCHRQPPASPLSEVSDSSTAINYSHQQLLALLKRRNRVSFVPTIYLSQNRVKQVFFQGQEEVRGQINNTRLYNMIVDWKYQHYNLSQSSPVPLKPAHFQQTLERLVRQYKNRGMNYVTNSQLFKRLPFEQAALEVLHKQSNVYVINSTEMAWLLNYKMVFSHWNQIRSLKVLPREGRRVTVRYQLRGFLQHPLRIKAFEDVIKRLQSLKDQSFIQSLSGEQRVLYLTFKISAEIQFLQEIQLLSGVFEWILDSHQRSFLLSTKELQVQIIQKAQAVNQLKNKREKQLSEKAQKYQSCLTLQNENVQAKLEKLKNYERMIRRDIGQISFYQPKNDLSQNEIIYRRIRPELKVTLSQMMSFQGKKLNRVLGLNQRKNISFHDDKRFLIGIKGVRQSNKIFNIKGLREQLALLSRKPNRNSRYQSTCESTVRAKTLS